jgi:hypothetical protein
MNRRYLAAIAIACAPMLFVNRASAASPRNQSSSPSTQKQKFAKPGRLKDLSKGAEGDKNVRAVATRRGLDENKVRELANDDTVWVDTDGELLYNDVFPGAAGGSSLPNPVGALPESAPQPYEQTFDLHSKPGAAKTILLDFNGQQIENVAWNTYYAVGPYFASAFDFDGVPESFSSNERDSIQNIWQRVSEDYAPFDVDVTTKEAGFVSTSGTRLLITNTTTGYLQCGCGGQAYLNAFGGTGVYQPGFVYAAGFGTLSNPSAWKNLAEAASHEIGHNLSLNHDGTATLGYYAGQGSWAPIMGVGYNRPVTQFSSGEYAGANNLEDDFAKITSAGLTYRPDDHGDTTATATVVPSSGSASGVITTRADVDFFSFSAAGRTNISVLPAPSGPDLDIKVEIRDASNAVVASFDPLVGTISSDLASNLGVSVSWTPPSAGTYYLSVDGVGALLPATTGYSDFGSRGAYSVSINADASGPTGVTATAPATQPNIMTVQWVPPTPSTGSTYYRINLTPVGGGPVLTSWAAVPATSTTIYWVAAGSYTATVQAYSPTAGLSTPSAPSAPVSVLGIPNEPTGVVITPGVGTATVSWAAPAVLGGAPISYNRVTLSVVGSNRPIVQYTAASSTSSVFYGVPGGTYTASVSSLTDAGQGVPSVASAPVPVIGAPGAPSSVNAINSSPGTLTVNWTAPTDDGGSAILYYRIVASRTGAASITQYTYPSTTSATFAGLGDGTYSAAVSAINSLSVGTDALSVPATVSGGGAGTAVTAQPGAPTLGAVVTGSYGVVTVNWSAPIDSGSSPVSYYRVVAAPNVGGSPHVFWAGNTTSLAIYLASGSYTVAVSAYNSSGLGISSTSGTASPTNISGPAPTLSTTIGAGGSTITASWTVPSFTGGSAVSYARAILVPVDGRASTPNWVAGSSATFYSPASGSYRVVVELYNASGLGVGSQRSGIIVIP